jgi:putative copper export protein/mono/diheme cytochrome c family protein/peroxiredoxin
MIDLLEAVARGVFLLCGLALLGGLNFNFLAGSSAENAVAGWRERWLGWARWLAVGLVLADLARLGLQTATATGQLGAVTDAAALKRVLTQTLFGWVWSIRFALELVLLVWLWLRRPLGALLGERWVILVALALIVPAQGIGAVAGHAGVVPPTWLWTGVQAAHILAVGSWIGGLWPLATLMGCLWRGEFADTSDFAGRSVRRFSLWATTAVTAVAASGVALAYELVGSWPGLFGTAFGQLVLMKMTLLACILLLAWQLRQRLLPAAIAMRGRPDVAKTAVRWVAAEQFLVLLVVTATAFLGTLPPAIHTPVDWLLPFRLETDLEDFGVVQYGSLVLVAIALAIGFFARQGFLPWRVAAVAMAGLFGAVIVFAVTPLSVDAYPTTYRQTSVPYVATSLAAGQKLFAQNCVSCHGPLGRGDGPQSASLPVKPADLTAPHTGDHTIGDLYWWLTYGRSNGAMPAFGQQIKEDDRWDMINYVRALTNANIARVLRIEPDRFRATLAAPNAEFVATNTKRTALKDFRGDKAVVLVLFDGQASRPRLQQLAAAHARINAAGGEVVAVARDHGSVAQFAGQLPFPVVLDGDEDIVAAYSLFQLSYETWGKDAVPKGAAQKPPQPSHTEFLIDRSGYLRARWLPGIGDGGWDDIERLVASIGAVNSEPLVPPPSDFHH